LWEVSTKDRNVALFEGQQPEDAKGEKVSLPQMKLSEHVVHDYASTSLSLKAHPVSFVRDRLTQQNILSTKDLQQVKDGQFVKVSGLVLVRQRPGTAGGICFMTIEDETGFANLVIFQSLFEKYRKEILQSRLIMVEGRLQREGDVIHVIVRSCYDLSRLLRGLSHSYPEIQPVLTLARGDEKSIPQPEKHIPPTLKKQAQAQEIVFPEARNFR
ncbi:MAG: OB-fold nucleic acid binding domain-containing protein, partial [Chitinophagaceae bacterium]